MENFNKQKIEEIAKKHELKLLLLFGSQASGKTHKFSDFDFGYLSDRKLEYGEINMLEDELRKIVRNDDVELVDIENVSPIIKYSILKNNKIIFETQLTYENYFAKSLREYFDLSQFLRMRDSIIANKIDKIKLKI